VEQEGVYLLPEAQIDRFLVRIRLDYPSAADEARMLRTYDKPVPAVRAVATVEDLMRVAELVDAVHVEERVLAYIVRLVHATRHHPRVALGASPRASLALLRLAKAWALLAGRDFATPDDVRGLLGPVLEHRVMVTTDAAIEGVTAAAVVADVAARTKLVDGTPGAVMAADLRIEPGPASGVHLGTTPSGSAS
jgi:MoxR-like ATPase